MYYHEDFVNGAFQTSWSDRLMFFLRVARFGRDKYALIGPLQKLHSIPTIASYTGTKWRRMRYFGPHGAPAV
jgi:hypothetical protein